MATDPLSRLTAHPWHGVSPGDKAPEQCPRYIEIVPPDTVKYELDKASGLLKLDRPQLFSNVIPCLYGFIPQSYCAVQVAARCTERTQRTGLRGDGDPLDICVLTEKTISHGNLLVTARPIGGLRLVDKGEVDDKIIAVLRDDALYGAMNELSELPKKLTDRLSHYFLTYKQPPGSKTSTCEIVEVYGRDEAHEVIRRSFSDYASLALPHAS
ncbi:MAG: inorganic pyrophosphatase [Deltaproteobacteria bacterium]|nr:inorganic pyrophosphatase [Deltaproteobacteria bacterium]